MIILPINTEVLYVDPETGEHRPAIVKNQDTPGSAYIWLDPEGKHTAHALFSEGGEKGTIHLNRGDDAAKPKPKPFKPGDAKNGSASKVES
jgi:hypothetical protein